MSFFFLKNWFPKVEKNEIFFAVEKIFHFWVRHKNFRAITQVFCWRFLKVSSLWSTEREIRIENCDSASLITGSDISKNEKRKCSVSGKEYS